MLKTKGYAVALILLFSAFACREEKGGTLDKAELAKKLSPALARVEYTLMFDGSEAPKCKGWAKRCPNCGNFHSLNDESYITEERPLETPGFIIAPNRVVAPDIIVNPRFVKNVSVCFGDQKIPATVAGYFKNRNAVLLELKEALKNSSPVVFDKNVSEPFFALTYESLNGGWTSNIQSVGGMTTVRGASSFSVCPQNSLIIDSAGTVAGISLDGELPTDGSWKGSPLEWQMMPFSGMQAVLEKTKKLAETGIFSIRLNFRQPRQQPGAMMFSGNDERNATLFNTTGVLVGEKTLFIPVSLDPSVTGRLEKITVFKAGGESVEASFSGSISDFGAFVATVEKPIGQPVTLASGIITDYRNSLLVEAEVQEEAEKISVRISHDRIAAFETGWRQKVYPEFPGRRKSSYVFDLEGNLVVMPVPIRTRMVSKEQWSKDDPIEMPAATIKEVLANIDQNKDPQNVPLSEQDEKRMAWMGVDLQPLDENLAVANGISHLTDKGRTGALVVNVYENSPAGKAGIKTGDIFLRIYLENQPKPLEIKVTDYFPRNQDFPWDRLGEIPEAYFERIPIPWTSSDNWINRRLTEVGFGSKFKAEFARGADVFTKDFVVEQSPAIHETAPKFKSAGAGLTVRDITYEVRQFFQMAQDDPGLIISRVEPGGKASVSGIKPFEIITHLNDIPLKNVQEFEKALENQKELKLSVKRMSEGRIVKLVL